MDENGTRLEFPIAKYSPLGYKPVVFSLKRVVLPFTQWFPFCCNQFSHTPEHVIDQLLNSRCKHSSGVVLERTFAQ